jgi:L-threonylcarbamoyladenylate synthase
MPIVINVDSKFPDNDKIIEAAKFLTPGKLIIYPTETFYGLGACCYDDLALKRIYQIKCRDNSNPILLIIENISALYALSDDISDQALSVAEKFWPGPLTLVFEASKTISPYLTGNTGKIGCRISSSPVCQRLLHALNCPITSTSANITGGNSPTCINDIPDSLLNSVDIILDAGYTQGGKPSTVIDVSISPFVVLRDGAIPGEKINLLLCSK